MLRSLFATATGKHLLLLGDTAAAITEFDGCVGHPIDAGYSSRDHRPAVGTGAGITNSSTVSPLTVARPAADKTYQV
jgi:hypothetical protein